MASLVDAGHQRHGVADLKRSIFRFCQPGTAIVAEVVAPNKPDALASTPQSSQRSGRFHTPAMPRAALGTAITLIRPASIKVLPRTFNP